MADQDDQRKLQTLLLQIRSYQNLLQEMTRQSTILESNIMELLAAIQVLRDLPKYKDSEAMIPLGARVFAKAELLDKKKFLVFVGDGIHVEKTADETIGYLEEKKEELMANEKKLKDQAQKIMGALDDANTAAEELYVKLQGR